MIKHTVTQVMCNHEDINLMQMNYSEVIYELPSPIGRKFLIDFDFKEFLTSYGYSSIQECNGMVR